MKIGLVGSSYQQRSLPFDAQRTINLIPLYDKKGADVASLLGTPGQTAFGVAGTGAGRECFAASNGRGFTVSGATLYEVLADGSTVSRGNLDGSSGICTMTENGFDLAICDQDKVYMFKYATNVFTKVTDPDLPSAGGIDFVDGYFLINNNDTGKWYISGLYDGYSWSALDFASAESSPDELMRVVNFVGQVGLFGTKTIEIWRNTGDSIFPFQRISGAIPIGTTAPYTVISVDTSVFWVGSNEQGYGVVYKAEGFNPTRVSTEAIEEILQTVTQPELLRSWSYQEDGHVYLCITGANLETTLCYDLATQQWHERAYLNPATGRLEQHRAASSMFIFGKHLTIDRENGNIYQMALNIYSDNGDPIQRKRIYTHLIDELKPTRYSQLQIGFEVGVGLQSGQGSNPMCSLRVSRDGAKTWSDFYTKPIGAVGKYGQQVKYRRLGISGQNTFELQISDPVKIAITGS